MTDPQEFDPTRYAAESLAKANIGGVSAEPATDPQALVDQAAAIVAQAAPEGWRSLHGVFSLAGEKRSRRLLRCWATALSVYPSPPPLSTWSAGSESRPSVRRVHGCGCCSISTTPVS